MRLVQHEDLEHLPWVRAGIPAHRRGHELPIPLLVTGGLVAIVQATSQAESDGWDSAKVIGLLAGGAALLAAFAFVESRVPQPLLPLRLITDRTRGGAYLTAGLAIIGMFGAFLFMTAP